jgi:hypothetical protein
MINLALVRDMHSMGANHALVFLLAVIMITAAIRYLKT